MNDWALVNGVIRINHLGGGEAKEGIDGNEDDANWVIMNGASPLKMMISGDKKGGSNVSFPKRREGTIIGLMD